MQKYYIKTNLGYKVVEGYKTQGKYGYHKVGSKNYTLTDTNTGLAIIHNLNSVKACKDYLQDSGNIKDIEERIAKRDDYNQLVKDLKKYKRKNPIEKSV